jgi:NitT/TauT family transport system permease protein
MALHAAVKAVTQDGESVGIASRPSRPQPELIPDTPANDSGPVPAQAEHVATSATDADPNAQHAERLTRLKRSADRWAVRALALLAGIAFWYYASTTGLDFYVRFEHIPGPFRVAEALLQHLQELSFYLHIGVSLERIGISYGSAAALGILLGLLMGRSQLIRDIVSPYIEVLRPIPAVAWIPLAILLWPTEEGSIIYITFLGALFPIVLNTVHGVEQTPEVLVRAAQSLGASRLLIFRQVILPGAFPSICTGLAIGMGVSWFSLLAGEIISGQYGIGYFTWNAYSVINYPDIVVGMLTIGLLGASSTALVQALSGPFLAWQRKAR